MYGSKIRYLASVFVDAKSITATARNIAGLAEALSDEAFLPVVGQERSLSAPYRNRIGYRTENGEWQLLLASNRFGLSRFPTDPDGSNLGEFSTFCQEAIPKLTTALGYFKRKAHRLAAVQEGFLPDMSQEETEDIAARLFRFPSTYSELPPFEWDWRVASRVERVICELTEQTNTITIIKRCYGTMISTKKMNDENLEAIETPFNRIRVDFDINTSPDNAVARFDDRHIISFFEHSGSWHTDLSSEIFSFILGGSKRLSEK